MKRSGNAEKAVPHVSSRSTRCGDSDETLSQKTCAAHPMLNQASDMKFRLLIMIANQDQNSDWCNSSLGLWLQYKPIKPSLKCAMRLQSPFKWHVRIFFDRTFQWIFLSSRHQWICGTCSSLTIKIFQAVQEKRPLHQGKIQTYDLRMW